MKGEPVAPLDLWGKLAQRFALIGVQGIVRMAMAGFDVAAWDALAIAAGVPLATLLGGDAAADPRLQQLRARPDGAPEQVADEAEKLLAGGFRAVKLRLGYPTLQEDLAAVRAVRARIGDGIALMVDYNQALDVARGAGARPRARRRGHLLARRADPPRRLCRLRAARARAEDADPDRREFLAAVGDGGGARGRRRDYVMPDLERIGGVTGWQRAAALAAAHGIKMSSHLFPEVSAHLLAATPTCHFLEYVDWADRIVARAAADRRRPRRRARPPRQRP